MFVDQLYSGLWGGRGGIERQPRDAETRYDSCRGRVKGKVKKCVKMQEKEEKKFSLIVSCVRFHNGHVGCLALGLPSAEESDAAAL